MTVPAFDDPARVEAARPEQPPAAEATRRAPIALDARGVGVRYPGCASWVLRGINLRVERGERVGLVGPSGGGKTTLLRALEGTAPMLEGGVQSDGGVALVYQDLRLVNEQSVLDNVCAGALGELPAWGGAWRYGAAVRARAMDLLGDLGLARLAGRRAGSLSGGQRQRVAIARALCARPGVVLADEPLSALDPENSRRILDVLRGLQDKHGFALVISTHDPSIAPDFFDRVLRVRDGELADASAEFAARPRPQAGPPSFPAPIEVLRDGEAIAPKEAEGPQDDAHAGESSWARVAGWAGFVVLLGAALAWSVSGLGLDRGSFAGAVDGMRDFAARMLPGSWQEFVELPWASLFASLLQTIQMALVGTVVGIALSLPLAVMASRQTGPWFVRWPVRFLLNMVRTVPAIFWALLFVAFAGLGPVAGVMALAAYSVGYLTKFFYETLEDADDRPAKALRALGASRLQAFARAILPTARPGLLGACLFVFEYNIRSASVLGVVGAGGIGQDLMYYIEWRQFPAAVAGLAMILAVVVALDAVSQWQRKRLALQRGL